ncbi:MAG: hypothetical protein UNLARM2_0353 [Candidatus Micrarchaeum acidiphilum ARMAN-2]|uniref:Aminoglycoside phosphotransferase domain-containing protein n=1 Tax=Candidatus Micrarchaeum acidiphilum ARMAN-2 TaxID=425595 RepID=C7DH07_MICA2|nr:MAG: hypothetical protein UNLARM2_0353 [Candidatus Micrarchaeum acidiphilum ARMAN-2]
MSESTQNRILEHLAKKFSLYDFEPLAIQGHTTTKLYLCRKGKQQMVAKIGVDKESMNEVSNNVNGYAMISREGGRALVPDRLMVLKEKQFSALVMPYLGKNITQCARDNPAVLDTFFDKLQSLAEKTLVKNTDEQYAGIVEIASQIKKWYGVLEQNSVIDTRYRDLLTRLKPEDIASRNSTIMVLDSTPDNFFVHNDSIKFIDPWPQSTYRGTMLPCIGIFTALLADVYQIPMAAQAQHLNDLVGKVAKLLDLGEDKTRRQLALGRALQFSLSSFVRINTDKSKSAYYAKLGLSELETVVS